MNMSGVMGSKVFAPIALSGQGTTIAKSRKAREELKEKIGNWKKKAWLDFCKLLMEEDKRYTLMPLSDYNNKQHNSGMAIRVQNAEGVFSNFCLTRTGELSDVYILPSDPMLGILIDAGSKYSKLTLQSFPSKAMVWPILRIADDLERQYTREVSIESNKHKPQGRTDAKRSSSTSGDSNSNIVSASS
jgi:hypothetical protein